MADKLHKKLNHYPSHLLTESEFEFLWEGSANSRFSRLKRALRNGELIRLRRGLYCLGETNFRKPHHHFELALRIYTPSYISLESALQYHNLIPEAVYTITSVTPKRSKEFKTPLGIFSYLHLPAFNFFIGVERIETKAEKFLMATPWKALTDFVYCYKKDWTNIKPLLNDLRIQEEDIPSITLAQLNELDSYYQHKRVSRFLKGIKRDLNL